MRNLGFALAAWVTVAVPAVAGPPQIVDVQLKLRMIELDLESTVEPWIRGSTDASWLGWHVPKAPGDQILCCGDWEGRRQAPRACELEGTNRHFVLSGRVRPVANAGSQGLVVLLRAADGRLDELRVYSDSCRLDGAGRELIWLEGVEPEASADWLASLIAKVTSSDGGDLSGEALMALSLHAIPKASEHLISLARDSASPDLRGEALFWLAQSGDPAADRVILAALQNDHAARVRKEAVFALGQLPDGRGIPALLEIARNPEHPSELRQEAFFWFVQEADDQALDLIAEILSP